MRSSSILRRPSRRTSAPAPAASPSQPGAINLAVSATQLGAINLALSASLWLTICSALLYDQGRAYRDAYLIGYGLRPELLPWDRGAIAYWGMLVGAEGFFASLLVQGAAVALLIATAWIAVDIWQTRRRGRVPPVAVTTTADANAEPMPMVVRGCFAVLFLLVAVAVVLLFLQWIQLDARARGARDARHELRAINGCSAAVLVGRAYQPVTVVRATPAGPEHYAGFNFSCSDTRCALYDPRRRRAEVVPLDQLLRFDTVPAEQVYWGAPADASASPIPAG
ncbi:hypothetical protein [Burkholderia territorii]|uniref:hypothetical protein n=1 Tax=Burkholderia territorii TaxID=1503055 RepID=UPI00075CF6A3|nr:hypothetical protein [Burkholderia territorii]KWO61110.1 hypothetical protein WT98_30715 [Burkholderia territorii]